MNIDENYRDRWSLAVFITTYITLLTIFVLMSNEDRSKWIANAKKRITERKKICPGCFGPRNNIITKFHRERVWDVKDIKSTATFLILPCLECKVDRQLELGSVSMSQFKADAQLYEQVVLLKDGKFNVLVGFGDKKPIDLEKFI